MRLDECRIQLGTRLARLSMHMQIEGSGTLANSNQVFPYFRSLKVTDTLHLFQRNY